MLLKHVGIRPIHPLIFFNRRLRIVHRYKYEVFPDGSYKLWSKKMLNSGCNHLVNGDIRVGDLIYCDYCDELFSSNQFEETEG